MTEYDPVKPNEQNDSQWTGNEDPPVLPELEEIQDELDVENEEELMEKEKGPGFLETIYGVFFSPASTFDAIAQHPQMGQAVLFFLIVHLLSLVNGIALVRGEFPNLLGTAFITFLSFMMISMALIGWFVNASILQLLAEFLGGEGRGRTLFAALGFAYAPSLFSAPISLLVGGNWPKVANLLTFAITVWVVVLTVLAVRSVHRLPTGKSVWAVLIPFIGVVLLMLGMTILAIMVIVGLGLTEFPMIPGM